MKHISIEKYNFIITKEKISVDNTSILFSDVINFSISEFYFNGTGGYYFSILSKKETIDIIINRSFLNTKYYDGEIERLRNLVEVITPKLLNSYIIYSLEQIIIFNNIVKVGNLNFNNYGIAIFQKSKSVLSPVIPYNQAKLVANNVRTGLFRGSGQTNVVKLKDEHSKEEYIISNNRNDQMNQGEIIKSINLFNILKKRI